MDKQEKVRRAVAIDVFDDHLLRPETGRAAAVGFFLEYPEAESLLEGSFPGGRRFFLFPG